MENIFAKYSRLRPLIKDGDLIVFHGTGIMANIIQKCDKAYYNHIGLVVEKHGALFIVDSNERGVQADRLSWRIKKYSHGGDFAIIKPMVTEKAVSSAMAIILERSDKKWIKYDFWNGAKELLNRKFGWNLKINLNENRDICSDFVSDYAVSLNMMTHAFNKLQIAFPEDYIRYANEFAYVIK